MYFTVIWADVFFFFLSLIRTFCDLRAQCLPNQFKTAVKIKYDISLVTTDEYKFPVIVNHLVVKLKSLCCEQL